MKSVNRTVPYQLGRNVYDWNWKSLWVSKMVCGQVGEVEKASVTDGTVALESLPEFLAVNLIAGPLSHTKTARFWPFLKNPCELGLTETGWTMFTCRAGMCKHNNISGISGRVQDRLSVHVCMRRRRKWDIQPDRNPTWGRTNIAPCWWNPANNVRAVLQWAERVVLLCYWKFRKRGVRNLRDYRSAGSSITATSPRSETIPASHADTGRCLVEARRKESA